MVVFHLNGGDHLVRTIFFQNGLKLGDGSQIRQGVLPLGLVLIDVTQGVIAQFTVGTNDFQVGLCQVAGADENNMLLVVAAGAQTAQDLAQTHAFQTQKADRQQQVHGHDQTGEMHIFLNEQPTQQQRHVQQDRNPKAGQFPKQRGAPERTVQTKRSKDEQLNYGQNKTQNQIVL